MSLEHTAYNSVTLPIPEPGEEQVIDPIMSSKKDSHNDNNAADTDTDENDENDENDDESPSSDLALTGDADSIIGISISHVQDQMRSPVTPAATKAHALESSKSYFFAEQDGQISSLDEVSQESMSNEAIPPINQSSILGCMQDGPLSITTSPPQIPTVQDKQNKRSSLVGSILSSVHSTRQRSSSGSSVFENFKKHLPELPAFAGVRSIGTIDSRRRSQTIISDKSSSRVEANVKDIERDKSRQLPVQGKSQAIKSKYHSMSMPTFGDDTEEVEIEIEQRRPGLLRRATSDQSLYLRKAATGASEFDDYNAWTHVSEMVNSRMKAITDSLQDSSLKIPKLPSLNFSINRPTAFRTVSDETRNNTKANSAPYNGTSDAHDLKEKIEVTHAREKQHPVLTEALSRLHGDLVLLGGYRGSILRDAHPPNRQLWVPVKVGLNLRKADLEVGLTREDELKMEEKIIPDGILSHIGPIDISRRLVRKCKKCRNVLDEKLQFHNYGYDWRLSPDLLSDRLITYLERLPCNSPKRPVEKRGAWVIAHSLGGLITRHAINRRPELFAGVLYAGTPQNCVNILGPLRNGDNVLLSSRVLTAQVNFTLRTSYALLPQNGQCFVNKQTGERYDLDFFDVKTWDEYRLSPCIKSPIPRKQPDKRQSIVGSISETISQHSSWLGGRAHTSEPSPPLIQQAKNQAIDAKDNLESAAEHLEPKAENPVAPDLTLNTKMAKHKPTIATLSTIPLPAATEYLLRTLKSVHEFKEALYHNRLLQSRNAYPPVSVLYAKNTPTVYGAFVESREAIKYDDAFDDLAFAAGDGVVLASAAQLPPGYRCVKGGRVETERGHVGLLGDLEAVGRCLNAIIDARERGVGMGAYAADVETRVDSDETTETLQDLKLEQPTKAQETSP